MDKLLKAFRADPVMTISGAVALLTAIIVPPSPAYLDYIDFDVIALMFCLMLVIAGLRGTGAFEVLAQRLLLKTSRVRTMSLTLILLCFFSSMLITNDVALIAFVPFTVAVLSFSGKGNLIFIIVMQTIAANLGSALTPAGNPQNLYLYSYFDLSAAGFIRITLPIAGISLALILLTSLLIRDEAVSVRFEAPAQIGDPGSVRLYILLFSICMASVFGLVSTGPMLAAVCIPVLLRDRRAFLQVDYGLLLTFVFFFIFVGNIGMMGPVERLAGAMIQGRELLAAIVLSQLISNVPAAVMLSSFTQNYPMLIAGANIGGLGTLVASLASMISYRIYAGTEGATPVRYIGVFTSLNLIMLPILTVFVVLMAGR